MPSFNDVPNGDGNAHASDIQQVVDALKGTAGKGIPLSPTAVNDPINFAFAVKNNDAGASKAVVIYKADGTVLFQVDKNGVIASPDGVAGATQLATLTGTQTLTNKTLTAPTITGPSVTGTVAGGAIYTAPHFTAPVLDSGSFTLTTGQKLANGLSALRLKDLGTIANAGTAVVDDVAAAIGILFVIYGGGAVAGYALNGGVHTTTLLFGPGATFTTTFNNAGTVNVYWNTTDYFLQNNTGGSNTFQTFLFSTG